MSRDSSRYVFKARLGAGGMGTVNHYWDPILSRSVAIKTLCFGPGVRPDECGRLRKRFKREARALARLNHPNLVQLLEVGTWHKQDDRTGRREPYIAMRLVRGKSLQDIMARPGARRVPLLVWQRNARCLAHALGEVHKNDLVHRDIKPGNIVIDEFRDNTPVIVDFGLVRSASGEEDSSGQLTQSGAVVGSPMYLSPEQAKGKANQATRASDVFSLGVTLYQYLVGRHPLIDPEMTSREPPPSRLEFLNAILMNEAKPPSEYRRDLPPGLDDILLKCLEKDPSKRYRDGTELAAALDELFGEDPRGREPAIPMAQVLLGLTCVIACAVAWLAGRQWHDPASVPAHWVLASLSGLLCLAVVRLGVPRRGQGIVDVPALSAASSSATATGAAELAEVAHLVCFENLKSTADFGDGRGLFLNGQVENRHDRPVEDLKVVIDVLNSSGEVVWTGVPVDSCPERLEPGARGRWSLKFHRRPAEAHECRPRVERGRMGYGRDRTAPADPPGAPDEAGQGDEGQHVTGATFMEL